MDCCFNPLDRGNLYQIGAVELKGYINSLWSGFNPLDRGNLYQITRMQNPRNYVSHLV